MQEEQTTVAAAENVGVEASTDVVADSGMISGLSGLMDAGGPVMLVLAGISVVALTILILKLAQFVRLGVWRQGFVEPALGRLAAGDVTGAMSILANCSNPVAKTMTLAVDGVYVRPLDRQILTEELDRDGTARVESLRNGLGVLELIATLAPLLGLLGTVLGMIDAFQALEDAGSRVNPGILAGGIWAALLTTAAGLVVAIPVAAIHHLLDSVVRATTHRMEDAVTRILVGPEQHAGRLTAAEAGLMSHGGLVAQPVAAGMVR